MRGIVSTNTLRICLAVPRKRGIRGRMLLVALTIAALYLGWYLSDGCIHVMLPPSPNLALDHYMLNRSLKSYLDNINVLIEPSTVVCPRNRSLLVLVTSAPHRFEHREAIRNTWGPYFPTYFIMGLDGDSVEDLMVNNYIEAKSHSDVIIYKFKDHYQNLTLKTALMMEWTLTRCSTDVMLMKTDDDVLVNPWMMKEVLSAHAGSDLIGYKLSDRNIHRDVYNKWYVPRWMLYEDHIDEYLSGTGYLINGNHLRGILTVAFKTPMINLEDVYYTYLVSKLKLGLKLTHDHRLSPFKPWLPGACMYFNLASSHSLAPSEMRNAWPGIKRLGLDYEKGINVCGLNKAIWNEMFLY